MKYIQKVPVKLFTFSLRILGPRIYFWSKPEKATTPHFSMLLLPIYEVGIILLVCYFINRKNSSLVCYRIKVLQYQVKGLEIL